MMIGLAGLDELVKVNEVTMESEKIATNPILAGGSQEEGVEHYRCRLLRLGEHLDVFLSLRAEDGPPTLFDVLFMLALDASGCDMMAGFEKYRDKWYSLFRDSGTKPKEIEFFWEELENRCIQNERFRDFLGQSAHEELLSSLGLEEGDDLGSPEGTAVVPSASRSPQLLPSSSEDVQEH
jgi:hypothetical protein